VATQGASAVNEVVAALELLDADPEVEVIVITRGGGSLEDLLPFSNETLLRAVAATRTPVVSAIGHETDQPLLDLVADLAVSTPTDAGKRIVPDLAEEMRQLDESRQRVRAAVRRQLARERELMTGLPERLRATMHDRLDHERTDTERARDRMRRRFAALLEAGTSELEHVRARVRSLSPQSTLDRGYAVVRRADGSLIRAADDARAGTQLRVRVAEGEFDAVVS
jgi:exodeoxyribonuclease VII large subunit